MNVKSNICLGLFKNIDDLITKIQSVLVESIKIDNQNYHNNELTKIISEIVNSYERDLKRNFIEQQYRSSNLARKVLSIFEGNSRASYPLDQQIQILMTCRKVLTDEIFSINCDKMIERELIDALSNLTDHATLALSNKYESENIIDTQRNANLISNLKIVKNDLQKQLNLAYKLIKNTPTGLAGCDSDLKVKLWNQIAENLTGYQHEDIIGISILNIFTTASQNEISMQLSGEFSRRRRMKLNIQTKDGGIFNAYVFINKLKSEMKQKIQYIFNFVDLSKDERLKSQLEKIEQLGAIARLSDAMMHDIRNPINSLALNIDVLTELFSEGLSFTPEQDVILKKINRQISNLTHNLNRYVGYSRITELNLESIDIRDPLDELLLDIRHQLTGKSITMKYTKSKIELRINGDWNQLIRVFRNLIDNAIEAIGEEGNIGIHAKKRNKNITISIVDSGLGVHPDNIQNVFKPYFTTKEKGSGLGLFIVREIVRAHHGKIYCTSSGSEGTRFTVSIPAIE